MNDTRPFDLITVCDSCLRASCWQRVFICDASRHCGTLQKTRSELMALRLEHPSHLKTDEVLETT